MAISFFLLIIALLFPIENVIAQEGSSAFSLPPSAPVVVSVSFLLSDINGINEQDQTFEFEGILTFRWKDARRAFDPEEVGTTEKVYQGPYQFLEVYTGWWPQLSLTNESGGVDRQAVLLKISPDGSMTYIEEINATVVTPMSLRRFPFDQQSFDIIFAVLGFSESEVQLQSGSIEFLESGVDLPQWKFINLETRMLPSETSGGVLGSTFAVSVEMTRKSGNMLRIVVLPLILLVILSWSIFWMDTSSVGERMDISFLGILTVVAYQIIVNDHMPKIAYFTLMSLFLYSTYLTLAGSIFVNLLVARLDKTGRSVVGDRVDQRCRWLFPLVFFGFNAGCLILFFLFA